MADAGRQPDPAVPRSRRVGPEATHAQVETETSRASVGAGSTRAGSEPPQDGSPSSPPSAEADPTPRPAPDWPACRTADCTAIPVDGFIRCLTHLTEKQFERFLGSVEPGADLDLRGTVFSDDRLFQVLLATRDEDRKPVLGTARFDSARFESDCPFADATFDRAVFTGAEFAVDAAFVDARFQGVVQFDRARFDERAFFSGASFEDLATFYGARFVDDAFFQDVATGELLTFDGAHFAALALFDRARCSGSGSFASTVFDQNASFLFTVFSGAALFATTRFRSNAAFDGARFGDTVSFLQAEFGGTAGFGGAQFDTADSLGPLTAEQLLLDRVVFSRPIQIDVTGGEVALRDTVFAAYGTLKATGASIRLDGATSDGPITVLGSGAAENRTALLSMRGVDASKLVLAELDLSRCRFDGAHHLDELHFEGCTFGRTPEDWIRRGPIPLWRHSPRFLLFEEQVWRAENRRAHWPTLAPPVEPAIGAQRLAAAYRQLRKAQEDAKNEPGAADFYYGEMEMRRLARETSLAERVILTLYWLVSGYGLRASRAVATLALVLILSTVGFATVGFESSERVEYRPVQSSGTNVAYRPVTLPGPRPGWSEALDLSVDSATALTRATAERPLTGFGRALEIALRLLGPVLLGLALLAVRNRVKR